MPEPCSEDIKYDLKHFSDIERVAMVTEKKWQKGIDLVLPTLHDG